MVCTDAAARGIDIPAVTHVLQASFAASAVDFLHRRARLSGTMHSCDLHVHACYLPCQEQPFLEALCMHAFMHAACHATS